MLFSPSPDNNLWKPVYGIVRDAQNRQHIDCYSRGSITVKEGIWYVPSRRSCLDLLEQHMARLIYDHTVHMQDDTERRVRGDDIDHKNLYRWASRPIL